ncbi:mitochondrial fission 1 protein-like isoform X2 [Bradysia coprophila]|uniref:mitochondrial fission 1 protein-like isoform X2 n=1 Tax=Bradysia coprophila TaxID=38358 RepID=UPI00187DD2C6|nr:mitochondrial fission 1 protein-like isoform X2 [Bradysia coprophila]
MDKEAEAAVEKEAQAVMVKEAQAVMVKEAQVAMEKEAEEIRQKVMEATMEKEAKEANLSVEKYKEFMGYLLEIRRSSEIVEVEKVYFELEDNDELLIRLRYEYARRLIGSLYYMDVRKGIIMMEGISRDDPQRTLDCFFYISLGHARLELYCGALKFLGAVNELLPKEHRLVEWQKFLEYKRKEVEARTKPKFAISKGTGTLLAVGGLVGLGIVIWKLRQ